MSDQTGEAAETGDFGAGADEAAGGGGGQPSGDTSQDDRPSGPSAADRASGTAYRAPLLDRPAPSDEPLRVRFEKEE